MTDPVQSGSRIRQRHNHIHIGLRYRVQDQWAHLQALDWNEVGFNFYSSHDLQFPLLQLRRTMETFEGTIVWKSLNTSDEVVVAELVNELIFRKAADVVANPNLHARLVNLIRTPALVEQKRSILKSLGQDISDTQLAQLVAQRRLERPMFRYGVKVHCEAWNAIVSNALSLSSVVISLEKWGEVFGKG